eukprot:gene12796-biopygen8736
MTALTSLVLSNNQLSGSISEQLAPLSQLYNSTEGSHWLESDLWASIDPPCIWHGVGCGDQSVVTQLDLAANNVTGQLPDTIWAAPDLAVGLTALL